MSEGEIRLLLVDDELAETKSIVNKLSAATTTSFYVESVGCLAAALERLHKKDIDVVLLDLSLPDSKGIDTLSRISAGAPEVPVLVLLGDGDKALAKKLLERGAADYVVRGLRIDGVLEHCLAHVVERRRTGKDLRIGEGYFRALIENAPVAILILDDQGRMIYYSPSMKHMLGYEEGENIGKSIFNFIHPDDLPAKLEMFSKLIAEPGTIMTTEMRGLHKDGTWRDVEVVAINHLQTPGVGGIVINFRDITDRKKAEAKLLEIRKRYRAIFDNPLNIVYVVDDRGMILEANDWAIKLLGYTPEEVQETYFKDLVHPEDYDKAMQSIMEAYSRGHNEQPVVLRVMTKSGKQLWVESVGFNIERDGAHFKNMAIARDVTEQKLAEQRLQEAERRYRSIFDNPLNMVFVHDEKGVFVEANEAALRRMGYTRDDLGKASFMDMVYPDDALLGLKAVGEAMTQGYMSEPIQIRVTTKQGEMLWVEVYGYRIEQDEKHYRGLAIARDITKAKKDAEALQQSEERFRTLIENASDVICITDALGTVVYVSPSIEHVLGYAPGETLGINVFDFIHPGDHQEVTHSLAGFLERPGAVESYVLRVLHKNGSWRVVESIATNLLHDPNMKGILCNYHDITERKEGEESLALYAAELKRSNTELEQFAFVASHDLQEPLRLMRIYTQLLERRYKGKLDADADEFIGYIVDGARRMQDLVDGLLAYAFVDSAIRRFSEVDCNAALDHALLSVGNLVEDSGAVIKKDPLPTVRGDQVQIEQLFQNLISNAIKFRGDRKPLVHVSAEIQDGQWVFAVEDNGIGIEPQYIDRIFTIFKRLHRQGDFPGVGAGLTLCKKIVERHEGRIWVESEVGRGSTFRFTIPAAGAEKV